MAEAFLHGVEVLQIDDGVRALRSAATAVVGVVATAPFADAALFPLDTPVLITRSAQAAALTKTMPVNAALGTEGTGPAAVAAVRDQAEAPIVFVRVDVAPPGAVSVR